MLNAIHSLATNPIRRFGVVALLTLNCSMNAHADPEKMLADFRSTAATTNTWQVVNDDVMGGVSTSRFQVTTNGMAVFSGVLSLENNGGFASVRSAPEAMDLTGCEAFVLRVRGDGRRYKFTVRTTSDWNAPSYQCAFPTRRGQWQEHRLAFKDFVPTFRGRVLGNASPLDPSRIRSLGFLVSDKQAGEFRLEIQFIGAGTAKSPKPR